ncbi:MAG: ABC transporter permease [Lachnospiraceae bacterium]|nr:ABC transporter permease [Lachnospiraceae bacterium]
MKKIDTNSIGFKKTLPLILVYAVMILLAILANIISPGFLALDHIGSVLRQMAFLGIACIGQTLVILTGGIDLSLRYTLVFANILCAQIISGQNSNTLKALIITILISALIGLINGAGIYFLKIPAMIMTLATGTAVYGLAYIYCDGAPKGKTSPVLAFVANQMIGKIFNGTTLIWIVLAAVIIIALKCTNFGKSIYAIGVNKECARYSGINVPVILIGVYILASIFAGITGMLFLGYTGTSFLSTGESYNMDSIAAVVVGGTAVTGGVGGYVGTIAGVGIMTIISSIMTVLSMPESGKKMVQGAIIIILLLSVYGKKSKDN